MAGFLDDLFGTPSTDTTDQYGAAAYNLLQGKGFNLPVNIQPLTITQTKQLEKAVQTAQSTGDKKWEQVANYVLKYGGAVLGILVNTGVIKSKNVDAVAQGEIDAAAYDGLIAKGKAYNDRSANDGSGGTPNTIKVFGVELTPMNLIILIVAIVLLYKVFVPSESKK